MEQTYKTYKMKVCHEVFQIQIKKHPGKFIPGCLPYQLVSPETFEERIAHIAHWNSASSMHINIGRNKLEPFDEHAPTKTYQELYSFDNLNWISDTPKALHLILNLHSLKLTVRP